VRLLSEVLHDLLRFLTIMNGISAAIVWALAVRQRFLIIEDVPIGRGWLSLRRTLPSELPERYWSRRRQLVLMGLAFLSLVLVEAFLILLEHIFFTQPA
jgi:hypothetical protein